MKKLTISQVKALTIMHETNWQKPMSAMGFADKMWGDTDTNMFTKCSNQGNGSTRGKAAWLCAGSYLAKLVKKGWVFIRHEPASRYCITVEGKKALKEHNDTKH